MQKKLLYLRERCEAAWQVHRGVSDDVNIV